VEGQGSTGARMTGKSGGMSPFQDLGQGRIRDEDPVSWALSMVQLGPGREDGLSQRVLQWNCTGEREQWASHS
jgi:hypothetical protein